MRGHSYLALAALAVSAFTAVRADEPPPAGASELKTARIQVAILLDTSGSMQGLINQARTQLWKIVNEFATARRNGEPPELQVALYEYGKSSIPQEQGYLRQIVPLTDNLDRISEELFALETNGGDEYCGRVIAEAARELKWTASNDDLKLIFIAGNEAFTQGEVHYKSACESAVERGITVNTIFCGAETEGVRTGWKDGALLADGSFLSINQDQEVAAIKTPFDDKLATLSTRINRTFVTFGRRADRLEAQSLQLGADRSAKEAAPAAAAERASFKGSGQYRVAGDLVRALREREVTLESLKDDELPDELKGKSPQEQQTFLAEKEAERAKLQEEIQQLAEERKKYIAEKRREQSQADPADTLDAAIIKAIRDQASRKAFRFDNEK